MTRPAQVRDWVLPLVAAVLVAGVGWFANRAIERTLQRLVREQLETVLQADLAALREWLQMQHDTVEEQARRAEVREAILALAARARTPDATAALAAAPELARLRGLLDPIVHYRSYLGFAAVDREGVAIASGRDEALGRTLVLDASLLVPVLAGNAMVTPPVAATALALGSPARQGKAAMFAAAPVSDATDRVVAALGFGIPVGQFTDILRIARMGDTGETYAFDSRGLMLSNSRFDEHLRQIGLLPEDPQATAAMNVDIRDPGGNLVTGYHAKLPRGEQPLTRMAAAAVAGRTGSDVEGYRDYRGVPVVGAWTWLPDMQIGVTTEVDVAEAFAAARVVREAFWWLFGLLVLAAGAMFFISNTVTRLRREVVEAQQLGQYRLEEKIGEGGIGTVYRARHGLLRRPTAIKVLHGGDVSAETLRRFEREVQVTSQLTHPNTIAVYDYGHTPAGIFYYAMEYLEGVTLGRCVEVAGAQPAGRVIHIFMQVCGSLAEAHAAGMIHRDIKPANLMLCERGGLLDFVKVLDFGLVRPVEQTEELALTNVKSLTGTPLYLSPDLIQGPDSVDARSDVYQLGAVAYYLLTGTHVFRGTNIYEVCTQHLHSEPEPPALRLGRPVPADLADLILRCLAKDRTRRPATAEALLVALAACNDAGTWTQAMARAWWAEWGERLEGATHRPAVRERSPSAVRIDLGERVQGV